MDECEVHVDGGRFIHLSSQQSGMNAASRTQEETGDVNVHMALRRIIVSEVHEHQLVELREVEGTRRFTIVIGFFEATSIDRRVRKQASERPLTHDLVTSVIEEMGGELHDILISDLRDGIYYAKLRVMMDGEIREIDCRPSDAIAVAVTADVPIYVADEVLDEVANESAPSSSSNRMNRSQDFDEPIAQESILVLPHRRQINGDSRLVQPYIN